MSNNHKNIRRCGMRDKLLKILKTAEVSAPFEEYVEVSQFESGTEGELQLLEVRKRKVCKVTMPAPVSQGCANPKVRVQTKLMTLVGGDVYVLEEDTRTGALNLILPSTANYVCVTREIPVHVGGEVYLAGPHAVEALKAWQSRSDIRAVFKSELYPYL
jgi:hypothetical protein